jgi:hypothetical protein
VTFRNVSVIQFWKEICWHAVGAAAAKISEEADNSSRDIAKISNHQPTVGAPKWQLDSGGLR